VAVYLGNAHFRHQNAQRDIASDSQTTAGRERADDLRDTSTERKAHDRSQNPAPSHLSMLGEYYSVQLEE
jgi:hypothetical protein